MVHTFSLSIILMIEMICFQNINFTRKRPICQSSLWRRCLLIYPKALLRLKQLCMSFVKRKVRASSYV